MQQKNIKLFIIPLISLSIFIILVFGAAYAFFISNTSLNTSNYQITLPKVTTLTCSKTDCSVTVTPAMMSNSNTSDTAKTSSNCSLNCTCSGTPGAVCDYNVRLIEVGDVYVPSAGLGNNKEFTVKVTNPSGCLVQNSSSTETQVNTLRDKVVSSCSLTIPDGGSVNANVGIEFKWYNLNIDQTSTALSRYIYQLTNDNQSYTVTFDANGGTVGTASKTVVYGEAYGELPTPTWSGHTFRGWNGKNKFNKDASPVSGIKNETGVELWGYEIYTHAWVIKTIKPSKNYHVSYIAYCLSVPPHDTNYSNTVGLSLYSGVSGYSPIYLRGSHYMSEGETYKVSMNFSTPANFHDSAGNYKLLAYTNRYTLNGTGYVSKIAFSNIQIEEGNSETIYEPFYVTETTKVTQSGDHTLTAIWD